MIKVLVSGFVFNILNILIQVVLGMLVFREMYIHFTEGDFGRWTLLFAILAHVSLFEFGLGSLISKLIPLLDKDKINLHHFAASIASILGIGGGFLFVVICISLIILSSPSLMQFDSDVSLSMLLLLLAINFIATFQAGAFQAYLTGKFKVGALNLIKAVVNIGRALLIIYLLNSGFGVLSVGFVFAGAALVQIVLLYFVSVRNGFNQDFSFSLCNLEAFRYIVKRGSKLVFMRLNGYIRNNGAILVCGYMLGAAALVPLRIASRLIEIYGEISTSLLYVLTPYFSSLTMGEASQYNKSFLISITCSSLLSSIIFLNMYFLGEWFLNLWLGEVPADTFSILITLAAGFCFANCQAPTGSMLISKNKNDFIMSLATLEIVVFCLAIYPLVTKFGVIGSAYATLLSLLVSRGLFQPWIATKTLSLSLSRYFTPIIASVCGLFALFFALYDVAVRLFDNKLFQNLIFLALQGTILLFATVWVYMNLKKKQRKLISQ